MSDTVTSIADAAAALGMATAEAAESRFDEWVILELMGHRQLAGRLTEVELAGEGFLRLEIPATGDRPAATQLYRPTAVYGIHPVTEELARRAAAHAASWQMPVSRLQLEPARTPDDDDLATCRICGCYWIEDPDGLGDLCSQCAPPPEKVASEGPPF